MGRKDSSNKSFGMAACFGSLFRKKGKGSSRRSKSIRETCKKSESSKKGQDCKDGVKKSDSVKKVQDSNDGVKKSESVKKARDLNDGVKKSESLKKGRDSNDEVVQKSHGEADNFGAMTELREKLMSFRDLVDLPPCVGSVTIIELVKDTVKELRKLHPDVVHCVSVSDSEEAPMEKVINEICVAIKSLGNHWMHSDEWMVNSRKDDKDNDDLEKHVLALLDDMINVTRERMNNVKDRDDSEETKEDVGSSSSSYEKASMRSDSDKVRFSSSPTTPTLVIPKVPNNISAKMHPLVAHQIERSVDEGKNKDVDSDGFVKLQMEVWVPPSSLESIVGAENVQLIPGSASPSSSTSLERPSISATIQSPPKQVVASEARQLLPSPPPGGESEISPPVPLPKASEDIPPPPLHTESEGDTATPVPPPPPPPSVTTSNTASPSPPPPSMSPPLPPPTSTSSNVVAPLPHSPALPPTPPPAMAPGSPPSPPATWAPESIPPPPVASGSPPPPATAGPGNTPPPATAAPGNTSPPPPVASDNAKPVGPGSPPAATTPPPPVAAPGSPPPPPPPVASTPPPPVAPGSPPPSPAPVASTSPPPPMASGSETPVAPGSPPPPPAPVASTPPPPVASPPPPPPAASESVPPPPTSSSNTNPVGPGSPPPPPAPAAPGSLPPPPPPTASSNASVPPPPPIVSSDGPAPAPPPPGQQGNSGAPPPPPAAAGGKLLRKSVSKLKRSSQMGCLYRQLKSKVEGSGPKGGKTLQKKASKAGASGGNGKSMADALAEMTKRSSYFQQIEEDVKNYANAIKEVKAALVSFQTTDMDEMVKFHKYVESHLEKLTDETQVLARFEDFPSKKLEGLRMAAALYSKLDTIANTLRNWKIEPPVNRLLDQVENYFNKIKGEVDTLDRTKDDEIKKFKSQKIHFDFGILIKIKELMVDVSSSCMELALKEKREASSKTNGKKTNSGKILWKAFQFAFRVYSFAGGQDDRADNLTKEIARQIQTDIN